MLAKHLKRLLGSTAIAGLSFALAYPAFAQTTYKTGTSVNVGRTSDTQLSRDELNENTHHDQIDEELDSEDRGEDIRHDLRIKQLEAAQTPYKPQHIADENEFHADQKKEIAQKKAIEAQRHAQALAGIIAAAKSLLSGAASALGNAANGGGGSPPASSGAGGSPSNPSGGGSPGNRAYPGGAPGGVPNNPALSGGGSPAGSPNGGGGSAGNPRYPGGINNYPISNNGGSASNPNSSGGSANNPNNGGGSASNPNAGGGSANSPRLTGNSSSNANGAGGSSSNPALTGGASSNANASNASSSGPGPGQRPLDFIPNALNGFVDQFQNGGQNLQNASNAMRGVAQTFEDQWTKPSGGINQVAAMAAFHGIGGALKYLAPAIKGAAADAAANAPTIVAKAAAATTGIVARAKNFAAKLFGRGPPTEPVNPTENPTSLNGSVNAAGENAAAENATNAAKSGGVASNASEPGASSPSTGENLAGETPSNGVSNLANQTFQVGNKTFELGAVRGDPGAFGTVYDIKNMPGSLLKVVRADKAGTASIANQLAGKQLLATVGTDVATPAMQDISSGGTNALVVQDVTKAFAGGTAFNSTDVATAAQKAAIKTMFDEMGKKGLIWEDGALRNTFVYDTPNGLRAGILDTDRIFPFSEMGNQSDGVQILLVQKTLAALRAEGVNPLRATAEDYMNALYKFYYGG